MKSIENAGEDMEGVQMAGHDTERLEILPNPLEIIYQHLKFFTKKTFEYYYLIYLDEHN